MKCSIIIPYFNKSNFISYALDSCVEQTYKNYEIIIVDDHSKIEEINILNEILKRFRELNIKIIKLKKNKGPSYCRNIGIENSNGEFLFFLDADDYWDKRKLDLHMNIYKNKKKISAIYDNQFSVKNKKKNKIKFKLHNKNFINLIIKGWGPPNLSSFSIKKEIIKKIGMFDKNLRYSEDQDLFMRLDENNEIIFPLKKYLTYFCDNDPNRVSNNIVKRLEGNKIFQNKWKNKILKRINDKEYEKYIKNYEINIIYPVFINNLKNFNFNFIFILFRYLILNKYFYLRVIQKLNTIFKIKNI